MMTKSQSHSESKSSTYSREHAWQHAASHAARAHASQKRKDNKTPYIAHCARVAMVVAVVFECRDPAILTAAFLHDILEDTTVDFDDLLKDYGREVAELVAAMSKDHRMEEHLREAAYEAQLASSSWKARMIKLADVYDNLTDAMDVKAQTKFLGKAEAALHFAASDQELAEPRKILKDLMERVRSKIGDPT